MCVCLSMLARAGSNYLLLELNFSSSTLHFLQTERYFLIQWLDCDPAMYDAIPARDVTPLEGIDILDLIPGDRCQASYEHRHYRVKIMAAGKGIKCAYL